MTKQQLAMYFDRIGYGGPAKPTARVLADLQERHFFAVPYENLDILMGIRLQYSLDALFDKIVTRRRGGYCFELNGLFGHLLRALGFGVTECFARFVLDDPLPKRRHRVLIVRTADDGDYVGDVGVGIAAPNRPVKLIEGTEQVRPNGTYRFRKDDFLGWVLQDLHHNEWRDLYAFTPEPQIPADYDAISYFCEYAPESPFNKEAMISLKTPDGRVTLDGNIFKIFSSKGVEVRTLEKSEVPQVLREHFGIVLPEPTAQKEEGI